jgi:hypothetical protein
MNDEQYPGPENELWDDDSSVTKRIFHKNCGGRVTWIKGEEHGCFKCGLTPVPAEEMEFPDEEDSHGETTDKV